MRKYFKEISIGLCVLISVLLFLSIPLWVVSFSMEPTFEKGDVVLVETLSLYFYPPKRGSLIVYKDPRQTDKPYVIKRVVGMPNETLSIKDDIVSVSDKSGNTTSFLRDSLFGRRDNGKDWSINLGPEDYLMLGDYRPGSKDGRFNGSIQVLEMTGRAYFRVWPPSRFGFID